MASQGPRVVTVISGGYCLGVPWVPSSDQFAHQETPKTWINMRHTWDLPWLTMTYHDLPRLNIHGFRCFKMRWWKIWLLNMRKPMHIYTQLHLWCKEQWLDRNVSAALRNDAPRIREEGLHIRQRPCATTPQHGHVQHAEQIHGAFLYPSKIWKPFLGWFSHVPTIPTIQHMY